MTPKEHIEDIQQRYLNSDPKYALDSLSGGIDKLERAFPGHGAFLMEFIQNADDAHSSKLVNEITDNAVRVFNDGSPFIQENVDSVCKLGRSSKSLEENIGYLGVGFKSVFLISDAPEIYSGVYRFRFAKDAWPGYPENIPWQVIPKWIEELSIELHDGFKTAFNLPLKTPELLKGLQEEAGHITNRMSLFLRHIERLEIRDNVKGTKRVIEKRRSDVRSKSEEYDVYTIEEHINEQLHKEYWLVFHSEPPVPADVASDYTTPDDRKGIKKREVIVAFRLDDSGALAIEEKGTAHMGVYSFLPLKDIPSGLNFLIQADFITNPARTELARGCKWNEWLADEIFKLITNKCIPSFLKEEKWKRAFTEILYSSESGHDLFKNHIKIPLNRYIETEACIVDTKGCAMKMAEAVSLDDEVEEMITEDDFKVLYPEKRRLDNKSKIPWSIKYQIKEGPRLVPRNPEMKKLVDIKVDQKAVGFFKRLYSKSLECRYIATIEETLLTENWDIVNKRKTYVVPPDLIVPAEVKEHINIVHSELTSDPDVYRILKEEADIEELTEKHIEDLLKEKEIPKIAETWDAKSKEDRIEHTRRIKGLWENGRYDPKDWNFITLLSKSGKWLKPQDLLFSKEYKHADHRIEELTERGTEERRLLTAGDLERLGIAFLSPEYAEGDLESWRRFLNELGLEQNLLGEREDKKSIVHRIAINTAWSYEREKGRTPRELESEGYDIESGNRLIEVKGSSSSTPGVKISGEQFRFLQKEKELKYYVYVVINALKDPELTIIDGNDLVTAFYSIDLRFNEWRKYRKEEFRPS